MLRPDQENWDTLQQHGKKYIDWGETTVKLFFVNGLLTGWQEIKSMRGHKSPLRKVTDNDES